MIYSTNSNGLKVFDLQTKKTQILESHTNMILSLSSYKNYFISSSKDKTIKIWLDNKNISTLTGHLEAVTCIESSEKNE